MKRSEATELVAMIAASTRGRPRPDTIAYFEESLARLDAVHATAAVHAGRREWKVFPSWAEFHEAYVMQKKLSEPDEPRLPAVPQDRTLPPWLKRWICARYLYDRFGREADLRVFPEELAELESSAAELGVELMPEGEWEAEAATITEGEAWSALRGGSGIFA